MSDVQSRLERLSTLSREMRLQALLQHARRFPELPEELREARDRGLGRVEECQTPLYLWIGKEDGRIRIHADAPKDAPTVRGFVGYLVSVLDGAPAEEVADLPDDLVERMGLSEVLGVRRGQGLGSVLHRIKRDAARA